MASNYSFSDFVKNDKFLVASANSALATGTLVNSATNAFNVANGQFGFLSADDGQLVAKNTFLTATNGPSSGPNTAASCRYVKFVQGTPNSADIGAVAGYREGEDKAIVESWLIDGQESISYTAKLAENPSLSAWMIGDVNANSGAIVVADETEYTLRLGLTGVRKNREYALSGMDLNIVSYISPDYSALGLTNDRDHLVQNFVYEINRRSQALGISGPARRFAQKEFVAFAVNLGAGAATGSASATDTPVVDIQTGSGNPVSSIPVVLKDGVTYSIAVTDQIRETFDNLVANSVLAAGSTVRRVDLSTAGAGLNADAFIIMALDEDLYQAFDNEPSVKVRLHVGFDANFNSPNLLKVEGSYPYEGSGDGRRLYIQYMDNAGLNIYTDQNQPMYQEYIKPVNYIDQNASYNVFTIENMRENNIEYSHDAYHPKRTILLVPSTGMGTLEASLEAIVTPWLDSCPKLEQKRIDPNASTGVFS